MPSTSSTHSAFIRPYQLSDRRIQEILEGVQAPFATATRLAPILPAKEGALLLLPNSLLHRTRQGMSHSPSSVPQPEGAYFHFLVAAAICAGTCLYFTAPLGSFADPPPCIATLGSVVYNAVALSGKGVPVLDDSGALDIDAPSATRSKDVPYLAQSEVVSSGIRDTNDAAANHKSTNNPATNPT
ncbi:hypothetical protein H0H87_005799, partial [Tephrocybe sp. NHM501043]